jgi:hypothetical protein
MSRRRNKHRGRTPPDAPRAPNGKPGKAPNGERSPNGKPSAKPSAEIPKAPPMADGRSRWPLAVILVLYAIWLAWLAYLALHSTSWRPGR